MAGNTPIVYWDTSAFLALIKEEKNHGKGVFEALFAQAGAFDRGQIILATSTVGLMEVLSANLEDSAIEMFENILRRSNFQLITNTETVARKAAALRRHCFGKEKNNSTANFILSPPDAIHVVSAMMIKADLLVTLDSANKPKNREMAMTKVADHYPVPNLHPVPIRRPAMGEIGTSLF